MHLAGCYEFVQNVNDLKCSFQACESVFLVSMEAMEKKQLGEGNFGTNIQLLSAEKKTFILKRY